MSDKFALTFELGTKSKVLPVERNWSIRQLYNYVALNLTLADINTFNLLTEGRILELDKNVSDYHLQHLQKVVYVQKTRGGASRLKPLEGFISLTSEPCCTSFDDNPAEKRAKMPCGCAIAVGTMTQMVKTAIKDSKYTFSCPGCSRPWEYFLVRHVLSAAMGPEDLCAVSRQLDENFVRQPEHDIRQCLMCKTYSQRDFGRQWYANRNRVVCNVCTKKNGGNTVEFCWLCGQQWCCGPNGSCGNANCGGPAESINTLATCRMKSIYGVNNVPDTRACPKCGMLIFHVEKCKHMQCTMCSYNFCFVCLKPPDARGNWQCGSYNTPCPVAPRQTTLPRL